MSFSGRKRPFYSSSLAMLLLIVSSLHIWTSTQNQVRAIRVFPQRSLAVEEESQSQSMAPPPPPPAKNQTQIFREYFKRRVSELNSTAGDDTFLDYKRKIPSCPDPLHN
ncbi:hypothetical protein Sango_1101000 [Sesamum angolense]|uniref:Uncharacterized protein n=1 Tax=Sesamum angolense TaxID=2727404 RepID=A0AAE2BW58_9LAMI|nr:hypothetical protein Sango_1101000 [Sesamum angolense]